VSIDMSYSTAWSFSINITRRETVTQTVERTLVRVMEGG
jgi:hypothetical protein